MSNKMFAPELQTDYRAIYGEADYRDQAIVKHLDDFKHNLRMLTPSQQRVIELSCGFDGKGRKTMKEIAEIFAITPVRAWQIHDKAIDTLRKYSKLTPSKQRAQVDESEKKRKRLVAIDSRYERKRILEAQVKTPRPVVQHSILRLPEVKKITGLSRSTIYLFILNGTFPKPVLLGERAVGWIEKEIQGWICKRIHAREK